MNGFLTPEEEIDLYKSTLKALQISIAKEEWPSALESVDQAMPMAPCWLSFHALKNLRRDLVEQVEQSKTIVGRFRWLKRKFVSVQ